MTGVKVTTGAPATHGTSDQAAALLSHTESYPEETLEVTRVETHISWVFLTERYAYKLRKPVRFDFLDYSTPRRRWLNCLREVKLGRRLAPDVYLGVVPITRGDDGRLRLGGDGPAVDHVVKMRRLPHPLMLDEMIRRDDVPPQRLKRLVPLLVDFYRQAARGPRFDRWAHPDVICGNVQGNFAVLSGRAGIVDQAVLHKVQAAQLQLLELDPGLFERRIAEHRICEGHGDLRAEHVCMLSVPVVFDPVEFSRPLRSVDPIDELAFLAMECDFLGDFQTGSSVLRAYQHAAGDAAPPELVAFYKTYRACVRAKVELLRSEQLQHQREHRAEPHTDGRGPEATAHLPQDAYERCRRRAGRYLDLAADYSEAFYRTKLILTMGLMGTGKSTLAAALADRLGLQRLQSDALRHELAGRRDRRAAYGTGIYDRVFTEQVYDELLRRAAQSLKQGVSVILDATFLKRRFRDRALQLAQHLCAEPFWIECVCPPEETTARLESRSHDPSATSDARAELYRHQRADYEPPGPDEPVTHVKTTGPTETVVRETLTSLRHMMTRPRGDDLT